MGHRLWRWVPVGIVVGGFLLSGWIARQLWLSERSHWQAGVLAETHRLTASLREAINASYGTLSALAAVAELNPGIEESGFLTALNSMESRASSAFGRGIGMFELQRQRWALRGGSERVPEARLLDVHDPAAGSSLIAVLESARARANAWTMSEPVTHDGVTYVRVALALTAAPEIVVVGTVDLERMVGSLLASGASAGIRPRVFIDRADGSHTPWLVVQDADPVAMVVPERIFTAGVTLSIDWVVASDFGGKLRQTAAWTALAAGCALSLLMGLLLWWQLRVNVVVGRRVEAATAALQSMLDAAPIGAAIVVDGLLRFANRPMFELCGLRLGEPVASIYVDAEDASRVQRMAQGAAVARDAPVQVFSAQREVRDILLTLMHHSFEGKPGLLIWLSDVTRAREAERVMLEARRKAEEATQAKSDFLANMSHEIRTPMNAIMGMSHLALQFPLEAEPRNYLEKVHRASEHLLGIINDILDFSKVEAGKMAVESTEFALQDVMDHLVSLLGLKARERGLSLQFDLRGDLPVTLIGDPLRLGQVLVNLGNNAVKFTENGGVSVGIEEVSRSDGRTVLHFWVRDSGIGMTAAQCGRLFQSFSQADASITRRYGGTGLGLAICKRLVELMQGRIWAESTPGVGSVFHFHAGFGLSAQAFEGSGMAERQAPRRPGLDPKVHAHLRGARLLLVEDNAMNQELAVALLRRADIDVAVANDGAQALELLASDDAFDGVLMDCQMPVMDGFTATARLRRNPAWAELPVIAMTANAMAGDRERVLAVGMNDHIAKPLNVAEMFATIARWVTPKHRPAVGLRSMPAPSPEVTADAATLVSLKGIDAAAGLSRTLGDTALYRSLLLRFLQGQAHFATRFAAGRQAGDWERMRREVHTLKGTAASIGADDLAEAAQALERACTDDSDAATLDVLSARVRQRLMPVLEGLRTIGAVDRAEAVASPALDELRIGTLLDHMAGLLADSDAAAIALGAELRQACLGNRWEPSARALQAVLDRYDFDQAQSLVQAFQRGLRPTGQPAARA